MTGTLLWLSASASVPACLLCSPQAASWLTLGAPPLPACPAACSHPGVLRHLRGSGERMLLLGHRSKWETVVVPEEVQDVVVVLESLPYTVSAILQLCFTGARGGSPPGAAAAVHTVCLPVC